MNVPERILMGPGPSTVPSHILRAMASPTLGHLDPRYIEIMDSEPPGLKDLAVEQVIRSSRFRPRIVDGEIVAVRRGYRFPFKYLPQVEQQ